MSVNEKQHRTFKQFKKSLCDEIGRRLCAVRGLGRRVICPGPDMRTGNYQSKSELVCQENQEHSWWVMTMWHIFGSQFLYPVRIRIAHLNPARFCLKFLLKFAGQMHFMIKPTKLKWFCIDNGLTNHVQKNACLCLEVWILDENVCMHWKDFISLVQNCLTHI